MSVFHIWMEGYAFTGEHQGASYEGVAVADTFEEACKIRLGDRLDKNPDGSLRYLESWNPQTREFDRWLSVSGCRLFDNEKDARKYFG